MSAGVLYGWLSCWTPAIWRAATSGTTASRLTQVCRALADNRDVHSPRTGSLASAALVSAAVVLPFMLLELINTPNVGTDFPVPLFAVMWILAFLFILVARPAVRDLRAREGKHAASVVSFVPRIAFLILVAWFWLALVGDQMPCFLGVPNCD